MSVAYTLLTGGVDLLIGQLYDRAGSHWTWVFILAVGFVSAALTVLLILLDKKAYPKLYSETEEQP